MRTIKLGDTEVKRIGLGGNRITGTAEAHSLLRRAVEIGINFIDTADTYQSGESETTIGNTLAPYSQGLIVGTKGGMVRGSEPDNSEPHMREVLEASLQHLKLETIYLYQLHRVDSRIAIEETMTLFRRFQTEGKIRHIGLSEVTIEQIKRARTVADIVSVQNQYNLQHREYDAVVDYCEENGIVFIPWFPLSRGNVGAQDALAEIATRYRVTAHQLVLAWLLKRSPIMLPIPGTLSIAHLEENLSVLDIRLDQSDFDAITNLK